MNDSPFTQFAVALAREHALNVINPERLFQAPPLPTDPHIRANVAAAMADEQFSEGRQSRTKFRPNFKE